MLSGKTDWLGKWYEVAAERGVNDKITFWEIDLVSKSKRQFYYSHAKWDGAGGLIDILEKNGFGRLKLPHGRDTSKPSLLSRLTIIRRALQNMKSPKVQWKYRSPDLDLENSAQPHYISFDREETASIADYCKKQKLSQNAFLIEMLNQTVIKSLVANPDDYDGSWLFPVNMRGPVWKENPLSNHSSGIYLRCDQNTSASLLHRQMKTCLSNKTHWGIWWLGHIGRIVGVRGMRALSLNSSKKSFYFGTFSNMGVWPGHEQGPVLASHLDENKVWLVATPGSVNYPVVIVALTWFGKLTMSLKIHRSICPDQKFAEHLKDQWRSKILQTIRQDQETKVLA